MLEESTPDVASRSHGATRKRGARACGDGSVLLAISRALPQWLQREDRGSFRAWLLRIARNEAVDMLTRRATRPLGTDGQDAERLLAEVPDPRRDLSSQFDVEYEQAVFQWAAAQVRDSVSDTTWQSFWLTHVEGLSVDSAAQQLKMRPGTVYVARGRVMNRIQASMQDWLLTKSLYERYGGRVGFGSLGLWLAPDGRNALIYEAIEAGTFKIQQSVRPIQETSPGTDHHSDVKFCRFRSWTKRR